MVLLRRVWEPKLEGRHKHGQLNYSGAKIRLHWAPPLGVGKRHLLKSSDFAWKIPPFRIEG